MLNGYVYRNYAVSLILNKGMGVMWHESLYHSGTKSRKNHSRLVKVDLRLLMYLWPFIENNQINRNVGTTTGVSDNIVNLSIVIIG